MDRSDILGGKPIVLDETSVRSRARTRRATGSIWLTLFLLPSLLLILAFRLVPTVVGLGIPFFQQNEAKKAVFVGLANFRMALNDRLFWKATVNMALFAPWYIALSLLLGFAIAFLLSSRIARSNILKALCIAPILLSPAAASWVFKMMLSPEGGAITRLLGLFPFIPRIDFLNNPRWSVPVILVIMLWNTAGFFALIFLAGLKTIDKNLYEAAALDGASLWGQIFHLILPHLKPLFPLAGIVGLMISYQLFDPVLVLRSGGFSTDAMGPGGSRAVPVYLIYQAVFRSFRQGDWPFWSGQGSAMTFLFLAQFLVVVAVGIGIFRLLRRREA